MNRKTTNELKRRTGCQCSIQQADMGCPMGKYFFLVLSEMYTILFSPGYLRFSQATREAMYQDYTMQLEQYYRHVRQSRRYPHLQTPL